MIAANFFHRNISFDYVVLSTVSLIMQKIYDQDQMQTFVCNSENAG